MMNTPMVHAPEVIAAYGGSAEEMVRRRDAQCPMGRMGDAWDVAYAALFLASDEAKYITGTQLVGDGGLTVNCVGDAPPPTPTSWPDEARCRAALRRRRRGRRHRGRR